MLNHTGIVDMGWLHTHGLRPLEGMSFREQGEKKKTYSWVVTLSIHPIKCYKTYPY